IDIARPAAWRPRAGARGALAPAQGRLESRARDRAGARGRSRLRGNPRASASDRGRLVERGLLVPPRRTQAVHGRDGAGMGSAGQPVPGGEAVVRTLDLRIEPVPEPAPPVLPDPLGFGRHFPSRMFTRRYTAGRGWHDAIIGPYRPLALDPAAIAVHC